MIAKIAEVFRYGDETHGVFLCRKTRDDFGEKGVRESLPIFASRQELQKAILLGKPGSFQGAVAPEQCTHSRFGGLPPAS